MLHRQHVILLAYQLLATTMAIPFTFSSHNSFVQILTARKQSLRRLHFHRCLSVHGGCLPHCMLGCTPGTRSRHPLGRHPPSGHTPCPHPQADIPLGRHPQGRHPPPGQTPPRQTPPLWADTPPTPTPVQCMLGYSQQAGGTHPTGMYSCMK